MSSSLGSTGKRLLGLATGLAFGALLQRGRLSRHEVILGQLLLRDGRVVKTMATAVAVGASASTRSSGRASPRRTSSR